MSDWSRREDDPRWVYGVPPAGNANYAWVQHFLHHLAPTGLAGFVLANGSMGAAHTVVFDDQLLIPEFGATASNIQRYGAILAIATQVQGDFRWQPQTQPGGSGPGRVAVVGADTWRQAQGETQGRSAPEIVVQFTGLRQ